MKRFRDWIFPMLIVVVSVFLFVKNYIPDTFLSGWDTLHPEFNSDLYLNRIINGVWMEHQGLGAVASQSHAAELPHLIVIWFLNLMLPFNLIRYVFFFLCLAFGALGIYFFSKYLLSTKWYRFIAPSAFLASLFYIFNLITVQQLYVPLEMFAVHYAGLPWLFYFGTRFIREGKRKNLICFCVTTLISSPMAHTATLFYVYLILLTTYLILLNFKRGLFLAAVTILLNLFWVFPNFYYINNHSSDVADSHIHRIFSGEAFLQSRAYGDFENLVLGKNFLFNWREFDPKGNNFVELLAKWQTHLQRPYVKEVGYVLFAMVLSGFFLSVLNKSKYFVAFLPVFLISVFFWINANPPFEKLFNLTRNLDLLREGFRFPFTKFSISMLMVLSVWFSCSICVILNFLTKVKAVSLCFTITVLAIFYFQYPSFQGYLMSPSMKVKIPHEYFEIFKWFDEKEKGARIVKLPLQTFWGWNFYDWGYEGAGFTWFGIPQSTLDREFDRWSPYNETFYNEASYALYAKDNESFRRIIEKYQVKYFLLDESIINPGGSSDTLFIPEIKSMVFDLGYRQVFKTGFLTVYDTGLGMNNYVSAPPSYTAVSVNLTYSQFDPVYAKFGDYIQKEDAIGFPFVNFDSRGDVKITALDRNLIFYNGKTGSKVILPAENFLTESFAKGRGFDGAYNCDLKKTGLVYKEGKTYRAEDGGVSCDSFSYPSLSYDRAYILRVKGENKEGRSLKIYLQNWKTNHMDLEELLSEGKFDEYFFVYPQNSKEKGYALNLETRSFGRIASENTLERIDFYPVDYKFLTEIYTGLGGKNFAKNIEIMNVEKYGTAIYKIDTKGGGLIELGQGYEKGWVSIPKFEHVKVNSWANGWIIPNQPADQTTIYLIFWPQFLEWGGFVLAGVVLLTLIRFRLY